jgi:hypothetical protein
MYLPESAQGQHFALLGQSLLQLPSVLALLSSLQQMMQ